jgi:folate-binding protein YgfZ
MLSLEKFKEIQKKEGNHSQTLVFRESSIFIDPRKKILGARIISKLENLYLTIKKLNLKIINEGDYLKKAHINGIPIKGLTYLKDQLFALEANFEGLNAIDFKKGCYIGQENTARMKLKNKIRKKLLPIRSNEILEIGTEFFFNKVIIGKILITNPYPFALIKMYNPNFSDFKNKEVLAKNKKIEIINTFF